MKELKALTSPEKQWPDITYNGLNLLDLYCEWDSQIQERYKETYEIIQSCYLGYDKDEDTFYMGFDCYSGSIVVVFKIKKTKLHLSIVRNSFSLFYESLYKKIKKENKSIQDVRLD